ncbi:MAG: nuclear transport factor 2 family protein [Verrucomicrobia bacterium]|nr:nuclear transport factor 2 family protein [Verrucomicrobiota bacterium]
MFAPEEQPKRSAVLQCREGQTHITLKKLYMNTETEKREIAEQFLNAMRTRDADVLRSILDKSAVWSLPGNSLISGEARGVDAVIGRAQTIRDHGMSFAVKRILIGYHGAALSLHNTAQRGTLVFDQDLTTVLRIRDGKVTEIDTYMSDVEMVNTYFAQTR